MTFKTCMRTLVDDGIRFVALCEIIAGVAALVAAVAMIEENSVFSSGDWKHLSRSWFVLVVFTYGVLMVVCGGLGIFGSSVCKGFCIDLHALITILLVSFELVLVALFVIMDRSEFEDLGKRDPYGAATLAIAWVEDNPVGSIAIAATAFSVQTLGFLLSWVTRICCRGPREADHEEFEEFEYEYAPLPLPTEGAQQQQQNFQFSAYETKNSGEHRPTAPTMSRSLSSLKQKYRETFKITDEDPSKRPLLPE